MELNRVLKMETEKRHSAEMALRKSQYLFASFMQNLPGLTWIKDTAGRYSYINETWEETFELSSAQVVGMTDEELWPREVADKLRGNDLKVIATGQPLEMQEVVPLQGEDHYWHVSKFPLLNDAGELTSVAGVAIDITDRAVTERQLRLQKTALESAANGIMLADRDGAILWVNPAFCQLTGYSRDELLGQNPRIVKSGMHGASFYEALWNTILKGEVWKGEVVNRRKDGTLYTEEMTITPIQTDNGEVTHFIAIKEDITQRKEAEEAIDRSAQRFRALIENVSDIVTVLNENGDVTLVSPSVKRVLGYEVEEMVGRNVFEYIHEEDLPGVLKVFTQALEENPGSARSAEFRFLHSDGSYCIPEAVGTNLLEDSVIGGIVISARDITERREAERAKEDEAETNAALLRLETALGESRGVQNVCETAVELLSEMLPDAQGFVWQWDQERNHLLPVAAPPGLDQCLRSKFFNPAIHFETEDDVAQVLRTRQTLIVQDAAHDPRVGEMVIEDFGISSFVLSPLLAGRELMGILRLWRTRGATFTDREVDLVCSATQRIGLALAGEESKEALLQHLRRINLLNRIARAVIERQDMNSIFRAVQQQLEDHLPIDLGSFCLYDAGAETLTVVARSRKGREVVSETGDSEGTVLTVGEAGAQPCLAGEVTYIPDVALAKASYLQRLAAAGFFSMVAVPLIADASVFGVLFAVRRARDAFNRGECEFLQQLGNHISLASRQAQLYTDLQQVYEELRGTQQSAMEQERLRSLGQMASGIAHDINNALSPIVGFTDLLLMGDDLPERARKHLTTIRTASEDVVHIIQRMRAFYRKRPVEESLLPVDLNAVVEQSLELTRPRWRDMDHERGVDIEIDTDLQQDIPFVYGIESELREALTDIIFNAVDAMPEGGTISVRTTTSTRLGEDGNRIPLPIVLEVADTGAGMDEESRRRCLEPFYTTKGEQGTGLGLAMVYGTAQRHGAEFEVESAPGEGTTIRLTFPAPTADGETRDAADESVVAPASPLRILCIDDEPMIRQLIEDILETDGHAVETAEGGQEGLAAFCAAFRDDRGFDVVITDLGMPHVDGHQVIRAIKLSSPATPIILPTEWGKQLSGAQDTAAAADAVLGKPPRIKHLRAALQQVISPHR